MEAREGKIDGVIAELKSHSPELVYPVREQAVSVNSFWVKKGAKWRYKGMASLREVTLGVVQGYAFGEPMDSHLKQNQGPVSRVSSEQAVTSNIRKLLMGRTEVYLDAQLAVLYQARKNGLADQLQIAGVLNTTPLYIAFSPKRATSRAFARMVSEGMDELRKTGKLSAILKKYEVDDWDRMRPQ